MYNYLGIFAFLADLWLYTIAIREITHHKGQESKIVGNILTIRILLWISIIFIALSIGYFLPWYNSSLALKAIAIIGVFTVISLINSSLLALMQAKMKIEFNLVSTIIGKLLNLACIVATILYFFPQTAGVSYETPFLWIMFAGLAGICTHTFLNYRYASSITKIRFLWDYEYIKHIIKITLPYGLALFLSVVYFKVDIIILSLMEPQQVADISVALYSLPMKIVEVIMIVGWFYLSSILPSLTQWFIQQDSQKVQKLVNFSFKMLFSLGVLVVLLWDLFKSQIIEIIANKQYIDAPHMYSSSDVFLIVLLVAFFFFLSSIFNYILIATNHESKILKINLIVTLINILGNILLIPKYSFMGSALVTVFSQIVLFVLWYFSTRSLVTLKVNYIYIVSTLIFAAIAYSIWKSLVEYFAFWNFVEVVCFWVVTTGIYVSGLVLLNRKQIIEHFQQPHSSH